MYPRCGRSILGSRVVVRFYHTRGVIAPLERLARLPVSRKEREEKKKEKGKGGGGRGDDLLLLSGIRASPESIRHNTYGSNVALGIAFLKLKGEKGQGGQKGGTGGKGGERRLKLRPALTPLIFPITLFTSPKARAAADKVPQPSPWNWEEKRGGKKGGRGRKRGERAEIGSALSRNVSAYSYLSSRVFLFYPHLLCENGTQEGGEKGKGRGEGGDCR